MRGKWLLLVLIVLGCQDDQVPVGFYDYQVERLLSGGDSKTWTLVSTSRGGVVSRPSICTDTLRLQIAVVTDTDSISISRLTPTADCSGFTEETLGNANASGDLVFTDSIIFASGDIWIINEITAKTLSLTTQSQSENWQFD